MNDLSQQVVELRAELDEVKAELATLRRRRRALLLVGTASLGLVAVSAIAQTSVCTPGQTIGLGGANLFCFGPNTPAHAEDVNVNFTQLASAVNNLRNTDTTINAAISSLTTQATQHGNRLSALEFTINGDGGVIANTTLRNGLANRFKTLNGFQGGGQCGQSLGGACNIVFPAGYFSATPSCVATARVPDGTGYSEHAVHANVTQNNMVVWEGVSQTTNGINLGFDWICVGP